MKKGVIFDFNGTLFFDSEIHVLIWKKVYFELFGKTDGFDDIFLKMLGANNNLTIKSFFKENGIEVSDEEIIKISKWKESLYREYCIDNNLCQLADGAKRILDYFRNNNYKMNLSSASIKENIEFYFEYFKLDKYFDRNLITYDNGLYHNKKEMYLEAAKNINMDIKDCFIFEDSLYGVKYAKEAGSNRIILIDPKNEKAITDGVIAKYSSYNDVNLNIFEIDN